MSDEIIISRRAQRAIIISLIVASFIIAMVGTCLFFDLALDVFGLFFSLIVIFFILLGAAVLMFVKVYENRVQSDDLDEFEDVYYDDSEDTLEDYFDNGTNETLDDCQDANPDAFTDDFPDGFPDNEPDGFSEASAINESPDNPG